jgi:hypothetical protein
MCIEYQVRYSWCNHSEKETYLKLCDAKEPCKQPTQEMKIFQNFCPRCVDRLTLGGAISYEEESKKEGNKSKEPSTKAAGKSAISEAKKQAMNRSWRKEEGAGKGESSKAKAEVADTKKGSWENNGWKRRGAFGLPIEQPSSFS